MSPWFAKTTTFWRNASPVATLLGGGLVIGSIDALYAIAFWVPRGGRATRIFQGIAAGLLGRAAFDGGMATVFLGVALHYFIATAIAVVYWLIGTRVPWLLEHYLSAGAVYGLLVYAVMNYVVIPLSAASGPRRINVPWIASSVVVHMLLIGIPAAAFARAAWLKSVARSR